MIKILTTTQHNLLRRCDGGLRLWEVGIEQQALLAELRVLSQLGLVTFDEARGFELSVDGESWLIDKGR